MMKHFSPTTNRLERCRAKAGGCRFTVHGSGVSDVKILEEAAEAAIKSGETGTYLTILDHLTTLKTSDSLFDAELPVYDEQNQPFFDSLREKYEAVSRNGSEFHLTPEDNSYSYYCYTCFGNTVDCSDSSGFQAQCLGCKEKFYSQEDCGALLRRSEVLFFSEEETKKASWFHSSDSPDWDKLVATKSITSIHAGSMNAAEDRVSGLNRKAKETWVYELRIKSEASVHPTIYNDDPANHKPWGTADAHVTRYMNLYEDAGSISVVLDASQVEVIGKHKASF